MAAPTLQGGQAVNHSSASDTVCAGLISGHNPIYGQTSFGSHSLQATQNAMLGTHSFHSGNQPNKYYGTNTAAVPTHSKQLSLDGNNAGYNAGGSKNFPKPHSHASSHSLIHFPIKSHEPCTEPLTNNNSLVRNSQKPSQSTRSNVPGGDNSKSSIEYRTVTKSESDPQHSSINQTKTPELPPKSNSRPASGNKSPMCDRRHQQQPLLQIDVHKGNSS
jgi:hypothetical protein